METKLSRLISFVFHHLLVPTVILVLLLNLDSLMTLSVPLLYKIIIAGIVFLITCLFPLLFTWVLFRLKIISSLFLSGREERFYPILSVTVFYYITYYLFRGIHISTIFSYYMLGATLLAILSVVITFYWKISLHMIGAGSFTGLFLGLSLKFGVSFHAEVIAGILAGGIAGSARLKLNSHEPAEIYAGFGLGVLIMSVMIFLL